MQPIQQQEGVIPSSVLSLQKDGTVMWNGHVYKVSVGGKQVCSKEDLQKIEDVLNQALGKISPQSFEKAVINESHIVTHYNNNKKEEVELTDSSWKTTYNTAISTFNKMHEFSPVQQLPPTTSVQSVQKSTGVNPDIQISLVKSKGPKDKAIEVSDKIQKTLSEYREKRLKSALDATDVVDLEAKDATLQKEMNAELKGLYSEYQKALTELLNAYNNAASRERIPYKKAIDEVNSYHLKRSLSNNTNTVLHYECLNKIAKKRRELSGVSVESIPLSDFKKLKDWVKTSREDQKLMLNLAKKLDTGQIEEDTIISPKEEKLLNKIIASKYNFLTQSDLNEAISLPGNWLTNREVSIGFSKGEHRAYVTVTEVEPQKIEGKYSPSGQRESHIKHPPNFQKTTRYLLDNQGNEILETRKETWRCGLFASEESADKAIQIMCPVNEKRPLFDNSLLTIASAPEKTKFSEDANLFKEHEPNASKAYAKLHPGQSIMQSNIGVNVGAQNYGFGWHSSIARNNKFMNDLNQEVAAWLQDAERDVNKIGKIAGVYELVLEIQAIWANNDYANPNVGHNPAKLPGLLAALAVELGFVVNTHCKSAKDRASITEAYGSAVHFEIEMNKQDFKETLEGKEEFKNLTLLQKEALSSGLFTIKEAVSLIKDSEIDKKIEDKIKAVKSHVTQVPFQAKRVTKGAHLMLGTKGIEQQSVLREKGRVSVGGVMRPSVYDKKVPIKERQRLQKEQRQRFLIALKVTEQNTGITGVKQEYTEALTRLVSGFDRDYVLFELNKGNKDYDELFGLNELDGASQVNFREMFKKGKIPKLSIIKKIESAKAETIKNHGKVSS